MRATQAINNIYKLISVFELISSIVLCSNLTVQKSLPHID